MGDGVVMQPAVTILQIINQHSFTNIDDACYSLQRRWTTRMDG
jgi:hypothetical protein